MLLGHPAVPRGENSIIDQCHAHEWHVDLLNSVQHFTFEFVPGFHHAIVFLLPAFSLSWFKAIRPIGDSVSSDGVE